MSYLTKTLVIVTLALGATAESPPAPCNLDRPPWCSRARCPLDGTTFYVTIGIPLIKDIAALSALNSLQCGTLNHCGDGKLSLTCPVIETAIQDKAELGYDKALNLAVIKSNISPGSMAVQVEFGSDKRALVTLRYAKYARNATQLPTDIPRGWDDQEKVDFDTVFPNNGTTYSKVKVEVGGENKTGATDQGLRDEVTRHATRVTEWFKVILGVKGVNGTVTGVQKKDDPASWTVFSDILTLSFDKDWSRDVFEEAVQKFNAEHFSLCGCLQSKRKEQDKGTGPDCLKQERYQKYLNFFDTESSICTKI